MEKKTTEMSTKWKKEDRKISKREISDCKNVWKEKKKWLQKCLQKKKGLQKPESVQMWKENFILCGVLIFCYQVFVWETTFLRSFFAKFMHSNSILHTKEII